MTAVGVLPKDTAWPAEHATMRMRVTPYTDLRPNLSPAHPKKSCREGEGQVQCSPPGASHKSLSDAVH